MADPGSPPRGSTHESRLLLVTIVICVVALLLLSRLRFPEAPERVDVSVPPLERLAARMSVDTMTADVERLDSLIGPGLIVLRSGPPDPPMPRRLADVIGESPGWSEARHVVALRLDGTTAIAAVAAGTSLAITAGLGVRGGPVHVQAADPIRHLAVVRVPEMPARPVAPLALSALRRPLSVVVVESTPDGWSMRPIQIGRGERFASPRWPSPLVPLGGAAAAPGGLVFSLSGDFLGVVVIDRGALAIADARDVLEIAGRLIASGTRRPVTLGLAVQALTDELALASQVPRGVVVAEVEAGGPGESRLRPGDVITALNGTAVDDVEAFLLAAAELPVAAVVLDVVRAGVPLAVEVTPAAAWPPAEAAAGVRFERVPGSGTRVVEDGTAAGLTGTPLRPGDLVVAAGDAPDPTPVQIRRLLDQAPAAGIVVTIRRDGQQFALVVRDQGRRDVR